MSLEIYRSINGLGGFPTGAVFSSRAAWIDSDTTYCLRVVRVCETDAVKYSIAFAAGEATLTVTETTGDTAGIATAIAIDATERLAAGDFWIDVKRVAAGFDGTLIFRPIPDQNNEIAHNDATDPSTLITYRCLWMYASEALTVDSITGSGVHIGVDALGETAEQIASETTAPTGIVFAASWSTGQAMAAGEWLPIWIKRTATETVGEHENNLTIGYTIGVTAYTSVLTGVYVTLLSARTPYYLYYQVAAAGYAAQVYTIAGITVESPIAVSALPYLADVGAVQDALHGLGYDDITVSMALRAAKDSGAESQNQRFDYVLELNYATGDETKPNAPVIDTFEFLDGGQPQLIVDYDQTGGLTRARRLYATIGAETLRANIPQDAETTTTEFVFQTATTWGASVTVTVHAEDREGRESVADTDTQPALWDYAGDMLGDIFPAMRTHATPDYDAIETETWGDVEAVCAAGLATLYLDGVAVMDARTDPYERVRIIGLAFKGEDVSGVGSSDPIETVSTTEFYLCAGGTRVAKIDTVAGKLYCWKFSAGDPPQDCPATGPYGEYDGVVYWQIFDPATGAWRPWLCVDSNENELIFCMPIKTVD